MDLLACLAFFCDKMYEYILKTNLRYIIKEHRFSQVIEVVHKLFKHLTQHFLICNKSEISELKYDLTNFILNFHLHYR